MTLSELGKECNLSETTIIRFINKLEYKSYQNFRLDMVQDLSSHKIEDSSREYQEIKCGDKIDDIKRKVISIASSAITDIDNLLSEQKMDEAVGLIENAKKIMFFGAGGSGVIATDVYHKFLRSGRHVVNESNSHIALIHASQLSKGDLLVLISHEGESKEVLECCRLAQNGGAKVIGITSYMNSDLAEMADLCIFSSTNDSPYYTEAMVSRIVQLVIMDMLFITVATHDDDKALLAIEAANRATREMKIRVGEEE
jgi:DNA-binding MurR/RpiR family transcriptional regulator